MKWTTLGLFYFPLTIPAFLFPLPPPPSLPPIPPQIQQNVVVDTSPQQLHIQQIPAVLQKILQNDFHEVQVVLDHQLELLKEQGGFFVVKSISAVLPYVDGVGHKVLHANDLFISYIINLDTLPHGLKEFIILSSIKLSIYGDEMGSHILQLYYTIVEKSF